MAGRRSERPRKSISYSKFSSDGNKSNDDDDDFMEPTPPNKKKKKAKKSPETSTTDNKHEPKIIERKSRNRLSDEDKYQRQLEEALKMSLANSEPLKTSSENPDSSQESTNSEQDTETSCVVQAEVLASPNTKLLQNSKCNDKVELRKQVIENEAAQSKDDEITLDPVEDNKETGRRKSGRSKKIKEKEEEDDYEMSDESESEDEEEEAEESDESDYEETPKKKPKTKKQPPAKEKKVAAKKVPILKKAPIPNTVPSAPTKSLQSKENKESSTTPVALRKPISSRSSFIPPAISTLPKTPKSSNFLPRRSPGMAARPGRFIQPGWTPPGPAGSKSDSLKSPQSPNLIRVGLSRNVRLAPLHPRVNIK